MAAQQLHDGNDEGVSLGQSGATVTIGGSPISIGVSTGKVGFYGATPVVKYSTSIATGTDTATTQTAVNAVLAALEAYGLLTIND